MDAESQFLEQAKKSFRLALALVFSFTFIYSSADIVCALVHADIVCAGSVF